MEYDEDVNTRFMEYEAQIIAVEDVTLSIMEFLVITSLVLCNDASIV